ncbi:hypothetical protein [Anabaenopsis elenkinii]|uniref:Uncharacterized protein n=1 Tax=Anabaenopsis elenkinii CCIBt3563 TaxID=2779889 RepID=A0A7U3NLZ1_9CYAN|nr:hypothetical protein [Anabaenopsis elenkinii]QOV21345.1 hypothetical protein IM676_11235 [Anabaenopsis elenkinii CCIBt3563]
MAEMDFTPGCERLEPLPSKRPRLKTEESLFQPFYLNFRRRRYVIEPSGDGWGKFISRSCHNFL